MAYYINVGSMAAERQSPQEVKLTRFYFKSEIKRFCCQDTEGIITIVFYIELIVLLN